MGRQARRRTTTSLLPSSSNDWSNAWPPLPSPLPASPTSCASCGIKQELLTRGGHRALSKIVQTVQMQLLFCHGSLPFFDILPCCMLCSHRVFTQSLESYTEPGGFQQGMHIPTDSSWLRGPNAGFQSRLTRRLADEKGMERKAKEHSA